MTAHALLRSKPRIAVRLASLALIGAALCLPAPYSRAETSLAGPSGKASASLNFRLVVPPVMRVLENSHPAQLQPNADGSALLAEQKLVVVSNMKHGFCVALRQNNPALGSGWQLQVADPSGGARLEPIAAGYRLCTTRPGHYTLLLQHAFPGQPLPGADERQSASRAMNNPASPTSASALNWPVQTELTPL